MSTTPHLGLPLLAAAQAQKHVTHNEALEVLDALVQCAILDRDLLAPPAEPEEGDRYIVAPGATGEWAGKSGLIVLYRGGAWLAVTPQIGFIAYVVDEALPYVFAGGGWMPFTHALTEIQNLGRLGIGTLADATNPFSAKLNKALWTARGTGEGGSGDLRYTLNKETAANVLSLLFQSGYSGRLELGLVGSDNLVAKVSADGSTWREALSVDAASGSLDFLSAEVNVASDATVDLGAQASRRLAITGTNTISSFGPGANKERILRFAGALTLVHDATSLVLPGAANITTAAGDVALLASDGSGNWRCLGYERASGRALQPSMSLTGQVAITNTASGEKTIALALANFSDTGGTRVAIDMAPNGSGAGGRSAQIIANNDPNASVSTLSFATAYGDVPLDRIKIDQGAITPASDGAYNLGAPSKRFNNSYFAVAPTIGSDRGLKANERPPDGAELRVARRLAGMVSLHQMRDSVAAKGAARARLHIGLIAQDVAAAFEAEGLDPRRYALFCEDAITRQETRRETIRVPVVDEHEEPTIEVVEGRATRVTRMRRVPRVERLPVYDEAGSLIPGLTHEAPVTELVETEILVDVPSEETRLGLRYEQVLVFIAAALAGAPPAA